MWRFSLLSVPGKEKKKVQYRWRQTAAPARSVQPALLLICPSLSCLSPRLDCCRCFQTFPPPLCSSPPIFFISLQSARSAKKPLAAVMAATDVSFARYFICLTFPIDLPELPTAFVTLTWFQPRRWLMQGFPIGHWIPAWSCAGKFPVSRLDLIRNRDLNI